VCKKTSHTVTFIRIDSWLRAKRLIDAGFLYKSGTTEPSFIIPKTLMLLVSGKAYSSKKVPFQVNDLARFKMIGNYQGSINTNKRLERFLIENPHKVAYFTGANILNHVVYMLRIRRLDIWLDSPDLLRYFVKKGQIMSLQSVMNLAVTRNMVECCLMKLNRIQKNYHN
jgi:hypothetical protein